MTTKEEKKTEKVETAPIAPEAKADPVPEKSPDTEGTKKRGRPPGAKTTPKEPKTPPGTDGAATPVRRTRKSADKITDTGSAIRRAYEDQVALVKRHNKEHPNAKLPMPDDPFQKKPSEIVPIPARNFRTALNAVVSGECILLDVPRQVVPDQQIDEAANAWHELSKIVQLDFMKWLYFINVGATTVPLVVVLAVIRFTTSKEERDQLRLMSANGQLSQAVDSAVAEAYGTKTRPEGDA